VVGRHVHQQVKQLQHTIHMIEDANNLRMIDVGGTFYHLE
jgi:hypothetical protein